VKHLDAWHVFDDAETLADHAAEWLCNLGCSASGQFAICLSGGSTPRQLFHRLAGEPFSAVFPWDRAHWFWGDERFVSHSDQRSNYKMAWDVLLSRAPVRRECIHPIETQGVSVEEAATGYELDLKSFYGGSQLRTDGPLFDVTFLGVGEDGHTASLFPGSPALDEARRWALAVVNERREEPRITLTYPVLNSSRNVAFLATGARKRNILADIRAGHSSAPAARVRPAGNLFWFVDRAAVPD